MDKKTLLGGAAALLLGAGLFAAPASAAIEWTWGGDASLTATMSDSCNVRADTNLTGSAAFTGDDDQAAAASANACASGVNEESPIWATTSKLEWSAGGTLANGLSVATDQDAAITLGGSFGEITFKDDGDSAAKASAVSGDGDIDVAGDDNLGGHTLATAGTDGYVVTYAAPSIGGMNLFLSYAPNSGKAATDAVNYTDTIGIGASFSMDTLSISAGWESADYEGSVSCTTGDVTAATTAGDTLQVQADIAGADVCGDQTLMVLGASMAVGDLSLNAGYSTLDSDEADRTTMSLGLGMDVGEYSLSVDYVDANKTYDATTVEDNQTVIGVGASTSLGDGVTLSLAFSNNQYDLAGLGNHTNYRAEGKLKIEY